MKQEKSFQPDEIKDREIKPEKEEKEILRTTLGADYDLVVGAGSERELKITVQNSKTGENILDFSKLAGLGGNSKIFIEEGKDFEAKPRQYKLRVPVKQLSDPREVFSLLHEIGHMRISYATGKEQSFEEMLVMRGFKDPALADAARSILQNERGAWAEAIKIARKMKKDYSVNLFKLFHGAGEFMGWLRLGQRLGLLEATGLRSYEALLEKKFGKRAFTKNKQVEIWREQRDKELLEDMEKFLREELKDEEFREDR